MKRLFWTLTIIALFGSLAVSIVRAQNSDNPTPEYKRWVLGPEFSAGASIWNGTTLSGFKTSAELSLEGGLLSYFSLTESFAFTLGIVYDSRQLNFHNYNDPTIDVNNLSVGYLSVQPGLKFKDLTLGLGIGLPMSINNSTSGANGETSPSIAVSNVNTLIEIRLGASIPIIESDGGDFRFIVNASYPFTTTFSSTAANLKSAFYTNDGPLPTLRAGFCYLFTAMK